jgi:hypothetical protein
MNYRFVFFSVVLATALVDARSFSAAQEVSVAAQPGTVDAYQEILAFSNDGRFLREVASINPVGSEQFSHVRAITYVAATGEIRHVWNLQPDTGCSSATTDGQRAVISVDRDRPERHAHFFLLDTETGQTQDIPSSWFDDDGNPYAAISGDGQFVSSYSESGPNDMVVSVYDWQTKKLVAKQTSGYIAAGGGFGGGVTEDGKIEFFNNRVGGRVVDPKTGRLLVSVGPHSYRSPDGAWDIEFPNPLFEDAPQKVTILNRTGEVVGKLDIPISNENRENWAGGRGAFCGTSGRFITTTSNTVQAFEIPSGKQIASFPNETWRAKNPDDATVTPVACSPSGKRVAIRSGERLTLHDLK